MKLPQKQLLAAAIGLMIAPISSQAAQLYLYSISISGNTVGSATSAGGGAFYKTGQMALLPNRIPTDTTNGANHFDLAISTGDVLTFSPPNGAFDFATNTRLGVLMGNAATNPLSLRAQDTVFTGWANNCLTIQPDSKATAALSTSSLMRFIKKSSVDAAVYYVQSGQIKMCTTDAGRTFTGTVNLKGTSFMYAISPTITYQAAVSARLIQVLDYNL